MDIVAGAPADDITDLRGHWHFKLRTVVVWLRYFPSSHFVRVKFSCRKGGGRGCMRA
ncbi:hypothetical protein B0H19DRAFT_1136660 [Mycena capillaripes]|nr:hypothetical protein B0H19DRAFT_1189996 [Mycena capillaripes]KAJ6569689.1 hypothetical protein B0H19DRAFT_1136660 [Mycena capillaripes]